MITQLVEWLRTTVPEGASVLVPVSGGSDSALGFWLCNKAFPGRVEGVYVGTGLRQQGWFEALGAVRFSELEMTGRHPEVERWAHFLTLSIQEGRVLVGSRNRTEEVLGTFSHASRVAAVLPLAGLWKHEVMELCAYVGVPEEILVSSRRADPECGRPRRMADIPFEVVDAFLQGRLEGATRELPASPEQLAYLEQTYATYSYKRELPFVGPVGRA